jgi:hypothetical protein
MASVEELKAVVSQKLGVARPNQFKVTLPPIAGISSREINLLCRDVTLPGRQMLSRERSIGLINEKIAYGFAFDDVSMTFLCLNDYGIKNYFEAWQNLVVNQETYEIGYKVEYEKDVTIQQLRTGLGLPVNKFINKLPTVGPFDLRPIVFDAVGGALDEALGDNSFFGGPSVYTCKLLGAYPTTMNAITLNNELDGLVEINIQLSYTNWQGEGKNVGPLQGFAQTALGSVIGRLI